MKSNRIIFLIFYFCLIFSNSYCQFLGGNGDGLSNIRLTNVAFAVTNVNPFLGGSADGHSNLRLANVVCVPVNVNPFLGGNADGHSNLSLANVVCVPVNVNPFLGGNADGHSNLRLVNVVCVPVNVNPFLGGEADGHSNLRLSNVVCTIVNVNPFFGGSADGNSSVRLANVSMADCIALTLPIELLQFSAIPNQNIVDLAWVTATEINNNYFTIERSADGVNFIMIEQIKSKALNGNSSSTLTYSTIDGKPLNGISYYRLKQTDFDGKFTYSNVVVVEYSKNIQNNLIVYPNPNDGENINISVFSEMNKEILLVIGDVVGKTVYSKVVITNNDGENVYAYDASHKLVPGVYIITASSPKSIYSKRLIVK